MATVEWARLKPVFDAVIDCPQDQRERCLAEMCPEPEMRRAVESLVIAFEQAGDFLEAPAPPPVEPSPSVAGRMVGPYRIIGEIGEGGMGTVYRAIRADDQYEKEVAIKLVRGGPASGVLLLRFRAERQILARLEHPNIARLLDGGTVDGLPYLVMELVEGEPIDQYCDRLCLSIRDRLQLFRKVCSAVQYAHQHLVVHRDIKPSNILVTADGSPKLLDFGIAKLISSGSSETDSTRSMILVLTPEYASPEQARGEEITTASDVYSLGVLLYLLLTGRHPYAGKNQSPHEIIRAISEAEPTRPSAMVLRKGEVTEPQGKPGESSPEFASAVREGPVEKLRRRLAGDLDNIVLQALRKEPERRYPSVDHFSQDIRRHLEGLPVSAREDTLTYRTSKFLRRNRVSVLAAALVVLALFGGMAATLHQAHVAERRFQDIREMANADLFEFHDALLKIPASAPLRYTVIARALKYLDRLNAENFGDKRVLADIAAGYERVADMQGSFSGPGIGDSRASLNSLQKALAVRTSLVKLSGNGVDERRAVGMLLQKFSRQLLLTGRTGEALITANRALRVTEELNRGQPADPANQSAEATAHIALASVLGGAGSSSSVRQLEEAVAHDERAYEILGQVARESANVDAQVAADRALVAKSEHLSKQRRFAEAVKICGDVLASEQARKPAQPIWWQVVHNRLGIIYERAGDHARALAEYRKTKGLAQVRLEADPQDLDARTNFSISLAHIAMQEARLSLEGEGTGQLDASVSGVEKTAAGDPAQTFYRNLLLIGYAYQGEIFSLRGDQESARAKYAQSLETAQKLELEDAVDLESRLCISKLHVALGVVAARTRRYADAQREFAAAIVAADRLLQKRPDDIETLAIKRQAGEQMRLVKECSDGMNCKATAMLRLPTLLN